MTTISNADLETIAHIEPETKLRIQIEEPFTIDQDNTEYSITVEGISNEQPAFYQSFDQIRKIQCYRNTAVDDGEPESFVIELIKRNGLWENPLVRGYHWCDDAIDYRETELVRLTAILEH